MIFMKVKRITVLVRMRYGNPESVKRKQKMFSTEIEAANKR